MDALIPWGFLVVLFVVGVGIPVAVAALILTRVRYDPEKLPAVKPEELEEAIQEARYGPKRRSPWWAVGDWFFMLFGGRMR